MQAQVVLKRLYFEASCQSTFNTSHNTFELFFIIIKSMQKDNIMKRDHLIISLISGLLTPACYKEKL